MCADDVRAFKRYAAIASDRELRLATRIEAGTVSGDPSRNGAAQQRDMLSTVLEINRAAPSSDAVTACLGKSG